RLYGLALIGVVLVTLGSVTLREVLTLANFTMIYLLLVVIMAIRYGTGPAFGTAFASFACINFFLVPPYYSLRVADPLEVVDLSVFLIVASIAGRLSAQAHQQAQAAQERAHTQEILYRLTRTFNQTTEREGVYAVLIRALRDDLGTIQADVLPDAPGAVAGTSGSTHYLLLQGGEHIYGTVRAQFGPPLAQPQIELLNTCVSQAAMALQRIDLSEQARRSQQFEEADRLKTAILHAVSHDLRTPITIIKTSASNLRTLNDRLSPAEQGEIAELIENEVDQLDKLVGNLLDLSRLKAGALHLNCQPNSLEEVVGDVAARTWQLTHQERIRLDFAEGMPLVSFDYGLLLQAISNLVDNSLRYEPADKTIEIQGRAAGKQAVLYIANHGATISDEVKTHMMEPFSRGTDGRVGLGLPIAKGIIEAHHGRLSVEDTPGGGATFVIELPLNGVEAYETQGTDRR
ncbi:MAG: DUF4118 domain-containing protein, partial [Anaerolineae bacterium]|nr:DUF4118 domain-containing protein [Anaerolineae bacterium]